MLFWKTHDWQLIHFDDEGVTQPYLQPSLELSLEPVTIYPGMGVEALQKWGTLSMKLPLVKEILRSRYSSSSSPTAWPFNANNPRPTSMVVERLGNGEYRAKLPLSIGYCRLKKDSSATKTLLTATLVWNDAVVDSLAGFDDEVCTWILRYDDMVLRELEEKTKSEVLK
jgi:hypothetical protein